MFEDRSVAVVDAVDLDDRHQAAAGIMAGEFSKRSFCLSGARQNAAFQHVFRTPWNIIPVIHSDHATWFALQRPHHLVFGLVVEDRPACHDLHQRTRPEGNHHRKILAALLRMGKMDRDVMLRYRLNPDSIRSFYLQSVHAEILDVVVVEIVWVSGYYAALVDVEAAVTAVKAKQGNQIEEIDILFD